MSADDLSKLPLSQRAAHYRAMADEALRISEVAETPEVRSDFMRLAVGWHSLALQIESNLGGARVPSERLGTRRVPLT